jgi:sec-independent protein translocase protein TatB
MFGLGMGEILIILVVALLVLGPTKLPDAAKQIGKAIRELRRHTQNLQDTIEQDENIGGTVRELKSALRGDDLFMPPKPKLAAPDEKPVAQNEPGAPVAAPLPPVGLPVPPAAAAAAAAAVEPVQTAAPGDTSTHAAASSASSASSPEPSRHG